MTKHTLSKTDFIQYSACPEELWMQKNEPDLMPKITPDTLHKMEQGNLIDRLAQDWFKDGAMVGKEKINADLVRFQMRAEIDGLIAIADMVVERENGVLDLFEVKAATRVKDEHRKDVAFQRIVFEKCGYKIGNTYLVHVNNKYVKNGDLDLHQLFFAQDITGSTLKILPKISTAIEEAKAFIHQPKLSGKLERICDNGIHCPYWKHYLPPLPPYSIFQIARIHKKKRQALIDLNIWDIHDVPRDFKLSFAQRRQVDIAQSGETIIEKRRIQRILSKLDYPLYFLDYETFSYVMPTQDGIVPYQQLVFQYSLHVIAEPDAPIEHHEFLLREKTQSTEELVLDMKQHIAENEGTIIVWNAAFEKTRNKELAEQYPQHSAFLLGMNDNCYDLATIFSKGLYLDPQFKGRYSIKKILPVLCPELSYDNLAIQHGGDAVIQWHHATDGRFSEEEKAVAFANLLKYCQLDTWAMVRIWQELSNG